MGQKLLMHCSQFKFKNDEKTLKKSFAIVRSKNEKIDSQRLCSYAYKNDDKLKPRTKLNPEFLKSGTRLKSQLNTNTTYPKELKISNDKIHNEG